MVSMAPRTSHAENDGYVMFMKTCQRRMLGIIMVIVGQGVRSVAMATAGRSFHHYVQEHRSLGHVLVTHGVYK